MPLVGVCEICEEHRPPHVPIERIALSRGPDGERLCPRHAREAWEEFYREEGFAGDDDR